MESEKQGLPDSVFATAKTLASLMRWRSDVASEPNAFDTDDIVQQFYVKALEAAATFDSTDKPKEFRERYILKALHNKRRDYCRDRMTRHRLRQAWKVRPDGNEHDVAPSMEGQFVARETILRLKNYFPEKDWSRLERAAVDGVADYDPSRDNMSYTAFKVLVHRLKLEARRFVKNER